MLCITPFQIRNPVLLLVFPTSEGCGRNVREHAYFVLYFKICIDCILHILKDIYYFKSQKDHLRLMNSLKPVSCICLNSK